MPTRAQPIALTTIGEIARRHDLATLVERSGTTLSGRPGYQIRQGICPISDHDTTGSFTIYDNTQRFYCFGCGATGDAIDFTKAIYNCSTKEALNMLGDTPEQPLNRPRRTIANQQMPQRPKVRDVEILNEALTYYSNTLLYEEGGQPGRDYLRSRGISRRTAELLQLGYSTGNQLRRWLQRRKFDDQRMRDSGLILINKKERFSRMIVVPELRNGNPIWMTGRTVLPNRTTRFNSLPGSKMLLGLGTTPSRTPILIIAEGLFDWLTLREWGIYSIALGGKGSVRRQVRQINALHADKVIVALDPDPMGRQLTKELLAPSGGDNPALENAYDMTIPAGFEDISAMANDPNGRELFLKAMRHQLAYGR